mmetsp:Transcript_3074/g.7143  ORF Transcript_3074/g.7143 Transcript_3074/m.7143 type:complete len:496 (+) Transcript_3074:347-1834(+)
MREQGNEGPRHLCISASLILLLCVSKLVQDGLDGSSRPRRLVHRHHMTRTVHLHHREPARGAHLPRLHARDQQWLELRHVEPLPACPLDGLSHSVAAHVVAGCVCLSKIEGDRNTCLECACDGTAVIESIVSVESTHGDAAASPAREGIVARVAAYVQRVEHLCLQEPVAPGGVVVPIAGVAGDRLDAVVVVIRLIPQVRYHTSIGGGLRAWVGIFGYEVAFVLELHELLGVLHGVVHAPVPNGHTGEVDRHPCPLLLLLQVLVEVEDGVRPCRHVVATITLSCNDQLPALELREQFQPPLVENDEIISRLHGALGLLPVPERVTDVLGLVQEEHIRVNVPGVRISTELACVVAVAVVGAGLLDVEQGQRAGLRGGTLHGRAARTAVGPDDQRGRGVGVLRAEEPIEEIVGGVGDGHVARVHVKIYTGAAGQGLGELHLALGDGLGAERVLPQRLLTAVNLLEALLLEHHSRLNHRRSEKERLDRRKQQSRLHHR